MKKVRQERDSVFGAFDCPDGSQVQPSRSRSTTPTQALNLFNSTFTLQQAEQLASRIQSAGETESQNINHAYELMFGRTATDEEVKEAAAFIDTVGWVQFARVLLNTNEFLFIQ